MGIIKREGVPSELQILQRKAEQNRVIQGATPPMDSAPSRALLQGSPAPRIRQGAVVQFD